MRLHSALRRNKVFNSCVSFFVSAFFVLDSSFPLVASSQQFFQSSSINSSNAVFTPALLLGMTVHPENPLIFDFIVKPGDLDLQGQELNKEALKMVKYFMASLTVPDEEMWVNLSPNEPERIVSDGLGLTTMGRDLLSQDYLLKQITSSMLNPESDLGKDFWQRIYKQAYERFGTTDVPVDTFNKVWIVPSRAAVYENGNSVFVVTRELKVMLEEDYLALNDKSKIPDVGRKTNKDSSNVSLLTSNIIKQIIIPELEKEVNSGKHFATLRQVYNAMILAKWYKESLRESLLGKVYIDKNKTEGIDNNDPNVKEKIYQEYIETFRKGVFDFIKEEYDPNMQEIINRKYFSGGLVGMKNVPVERYKDFAMLGGSQSEQLAVGGKGALDFKVSLMDLGPDAQALPEGYYRKFAVDFMQPFVKDSFEKIEKSKYFEGAVSEKIMTELFRGVDITDSLGELTLNIGKNRPLNEMIESGALMMTIAKKHYKNPETGEWLRIDWEKVPDVHKLIVNKGNESRQLNFPVSFKGAYYGNNGDQYHDYQTDVYYMNYNGSLLLIFDVRDEENLYDHIIQDLEKNQNSFIQDGLLARTVVEFYKSIGAAPEILYFNEGPLAFIYAAILNDIEFNRKEGTRSYFEGIKIVFTNNDSSVSITPVTDNVAELRRKVGQDLIPPYMITNGKFDPIEAIKQNTGEFVEGVEMIMKEGSLVEERKNKFMGLDDINIDIQSPEIKEPPYYVDLFKPGLSLSQVFAALEGRIFRGDDLLKLPNKDWRILSDDLDMSKGDGRFKHEPPTFTDQVGRQIRFLSKKSLTTRDPFSPVDVLIKADQTGTGPVLDNAQTAKEIVNTIKPPGGIDLNPRLLDLQIKRDNSGVPLPLPQQPLHEMKIQGFLPVIINVTPVPNLSILLGKAVPQG